MSKTAKTDYSNLGFAFKMEFHRPSGSYAAVAECVRLNEQTSEPYHVFPANYGPEFEGLRLLAYFTNDDRFTLIGFDFDYLKFLPINIACAEKMVKVMRTLGRRLDKLDVEEGRAHTFGQEIRRVCDILGFGQIWTQPRRAAGDLTWVRHTVEVGTDKIDAMIFDEERRRYAEGNKTAAVAAD